MSQVILLQPGRWVSEEVLMTTTGLKRGTIKSARDNAAWLEGREYKHISTAGVPKENSAIMYNREAVDKWIEKMPKAIPRERKSA